MSTVEGAFRTLIFAQSPPQDELPERLAIYRHLVRKGISSAVAERLPHTAHFAGETRLQEWISRWLDAVGPTTRLYWQLPVEFVEWFAQNHDAESEVFVEIAQWEVLQVISMNAPDAFADKLPLHPACRLGVFFYPVYSLCENDSLPQKLHSPAFILIYRTEEKCLWKMLQPQVAQLLNQLAQGHTLGQSLAFLENMYGVIDKEFLLSQLRELQHQGVFAPQVS